MGAEHKGPKTYGKDNNSVDANGSKKHSLIALTTITQFPVRIHHSLSWKTKKRRVEVEKKQIRNQES